jgi:hypothetical protein
MVFSRCLQNRDLELYCACQEAVRQTEEQNAVLVVERQRYHMALREFFTAETEASIISPLAFLLGFIPAAGEYQGCSSAELEQLQAENDGACCSFLAPAFFEDAAGRPMVRGTRLPFPADGPTCKYAALFDIRPVFDALRDAFVKESTEFRLLLGDVMGPLEDAGVQGVVLNFLDVWDEYEQCKCRAEPPADFASRAWLAYTDALRSHQYFLSVDELLFICECASFNVVVFQQIGAHLLVAGHALCTPAPPVLVKLRGSGSRRVRTHFERLVPQTCCSAPSLGLLGAVQRRNASEPEPKTLAEVAPGSAASGADGEAELASGAAGASSSGATFGSVVDGLHVPASTLDERSQVEGNDEAGDVIPHPGCGSESVSKKNIPSEDCSDSEDMFDGRMSEDLSDSSSSSSTSSEASVEGESAVPEQKVPDNAVCASHDDQQAHAPEKKKDGSQSDDEGGDAFSDISDNSDIFHVECVTSEAPRTPEDADLARIRRLAAHMRKYPLLPPDPDSPEESFMDVDSGMELPSLHCAFRACLWTATVPDDDHWGMERRLEEHIRSEHGDQQMSEVLAHIKQLREKERVQTPEDPLLRAVAYYTAAICEREREHVPLLGPSIDRRSLSLVCKLARSENLQALICFGCAQLHTWVRCWQGTKKTQFQSHGNIRMKSVQGSLLSLENKNPELFMRAFSVEGFKARYARDDAPGGNPFANDDVLSSDCWEWRRRLLLPSKDQHVDILCCPEDVERSKHCIAHEDFELCHGCRIPLCSCCEKHLFAKKASMPPMILCNDNFWGYTTDILYKYKVRWLEAAIVQPCWTTMLVFYAEGDFGHLMNEVMGKQAYRTAVRGSCCSFHMPWEDILHELQEKCESKSLLEVPRPQECLKYLWRAHLRVSGVDFKKQLKQLHVRPFVLLRLLYFLIDQGHEVRENATSDVSVG